MTLSRYCLGISFFFCFFYLLFDYYATEPSGVMVITYDSLVNSVLVTPSAVPLSVTLQTGSTTLQKSETIQFFGDVLLGRNVERLMQKNGSNYPFLHISEVVGTSTFVFVNFEASVPEIHVPTPDLVTKFSVDSSLLSLLRLSGITHVSVANNHSFDYGSPGLENTLLTLTKAQLTPFGNPNTISSSSVSYVTIDGYTVAIIAMNAVFFDPADQELETIVIESKKYSDIQIAYIHWGTEYQTTHSLRQEKLAKRLVALGIDAIVGHHPHVVQDIQLVSGAPVFYSLGNFIFDQYFSSAVQTGLSVSLERTATQLIFTLIPLSSTENRSQPTLSRGAVAADFFNLLAERSDHTLGKDIKLGKVIVPFTLATSSKTSMLSE